MDNHARRLTIAAMAGGAVCLLLGGAIGANCRKDIAPRLPCTSPTLSGVDTPVPPPSPQIATPVAPPPVAAPVPRDIGTPPYKLQSLTVVRWEGEAWRVRVNLRVTRVREAPEGTQLGTKMTCQVGSVRHVSSGSIGAPGGPLGLGETGDTFNDHFFHTPFPGIPQQCELELYVQMPGARPDVIDHDAGRICIIPDGKIDQVTNAPCPVVVEAPSP